MEQIEIKKETPPQRCEICHQSDYFDALNNYCIRCSNVTRPIEPISMSKKRSQEYFFAVSIPKLVVMSIFTLNFYHVYWFYKNWDYLNDREKLFIRPGMRGLFCLIFCYSLFRHISKAAKELSIETNLIASIAAIIYVVLRLADRLPGAFVVLGFFSFIPLIFVQQLINKIHLQVAPNIPIDNKFSKSNIVLIVVVGIVFVLALIGFFAPVSE